MPKRLNAKKICEGGQVIIRRAGEVIPEVVAMADSSQSPEHNSSFSFPAHCPACQTAVIKDSEDEAIWRCPNSECPARCQERLKHFVSRNALDIEGLGSKMIEQLYSAQLLRTPDDIFYLKYADLLKLERMAEKSAKNLLQAIEQSKQAGLARVLFGLGIRHVGQYAAALLAKEFGTLAKLQQAAAEQLSSIPGIGDKTAEALQSALQKPGLQKPCRGCRQQGLS